eukprot:10964128-Karenia_brevis.AAC.1
MKAVGSLVGYYDPTPVSVQLDRVAQACGGKDQWAGAMKHVKTFVAPFMDPYSVMVMLSTTLAWNTCTQLHATRTGCISVRRSMRLAVRYSGDSKNLTAG